MLMRWRWLNRCSRWKQTRCHVDTWSREERQRYLLQCDFLCEKVKLITGRITDALLIQWNQELRIHTVKISTNRVKHPALQSKDVPALKVLSLNEEQWRGTLTNFGANLLPLCSWELPSSAVRNLFLIVYYSSIAASFAYLPQSYFHPHHNNTTPLHPKFLIRKVRLTSIFLHWHPFTLSVTHLVPQKTSGTRAAISPRFHPLVAIPVSKLRYNTLVFSCSPKYEEVNTTLKGTIWMNIWCETRTIEHS
jgi:hypothetical protein